MGRIMVLVVIMGLGVTLAQAQYAHTVRGRVIESRTREPFAGARVEYVGTSWTRSSFTTEDGWFEIGGLPAGTATVRCEVVGWTGEIYRRQALVEVGQAEANGLLFVISYTALPPITNGLLAAWPLDGDASDIWSNHLTGIVEGAKPATDRHGAIGGAMQFDGTSRIVMPDHPGFAALPMTITFWMRVDTIQGENVFFLGKYLRPSGEGYLLVFERGLLVGEYTRFNFSNWSRIDLQYIPDRQWHFYAMRIDASGVTLFRDDLKMPARGFGSTPSPTTSTQRFAIGRLESAMTNSVTHGLIGAIDDLCLFTRDLSNDEIDQMRQR